MFSNMCGMHGRDDELTLMTTERAQKPGGKDADGNSVPTMDDWIKGNGSPPKGNNGKGSGKGRTNDRSEVKESKSQDPSPQRPPKNSAGPPSDAGSRRSGRSGRDREYYPEPRGNGVIDTRQFQPPRTLDDAMDLCPDTYGGGVRGPEPLLVGCVAIETICRGDLTHWKEKLFQDNEAKLSITIDQPGVRFCLASSPHTPLVTGFFWCELPDITVDEAVVALTNKDMREAWDPDSLYQVLEEPREDDAFREQVHHHTIKVPWPLWDRDVLQRKWQVPLEDGGVALVSQSVDAPNLFARREGKIRAVVHMGGLILRPVEADNSELGRSGIEVTLVNKLDIGGAAPYWAQSLLARFGSRQSENWAERLRGHCFAMRNMELEAGGPIAEDDDQASYYDNISIAPSQGGSDSKLSREMMGQ